MKRGKAVLVLAALVLAAGMRRSPRRSRDQEPSADQEPAANEAGGDDMSPMDIARVRFKALDDLVGQADPNLGGYVDTIGRLYVLLRDVPSSRPTYTAVDVERLSELVQSDFEDVLSPEERKNALNRGAALVLFHTNATGLRKGPPEKWRPVMLAGMIAAAAAAEQPDGGGPPEDWSEDEEAWNDEEEDQADDDEEDQADDDDQGCKFRTWGWDSIAADLELEKPIDYGWDLLNWTQVAAAWNNITSDKHCWRLTDADMAELSDLPPLALWANIGEPPPHVLAAAAELYYQRKGAFPTSWAQATGEIAFVNKHLLQ